MADHSRPLTTSTYANFVTELDGRFDDLILGLDPAFVTATNIPTNSIRYSSGATKWQRWNGSSWGDLAASYAINITGNAGTVTNGVVTTGSYSDPAWITSLAGAKISGNIAGNAGSASVLATARNINGVSFNGSANISVNLNNNVTFNNAGSGSASGVTFNGGSAITISHNTIGAAPLNGAGTSGTWNISITGNAASVSSGVYTVGDQTIGGNKTFTGATSVTALTVGASDMSYIGMRDDNSPNGLKYVHANSNMIGFLGGSGNWIMNVDEGGNLGTTGNITAAGNVTANSDERLKQNWRDLDADFLALLANLKMGVYDRIDSGETQVGVSAQALQRFLPQAVCANDKGILSVAYGNAALVAAVVLAREVVSLRRELNQMKGA